MHIAPPHRLLARALAIASLIITGFVLPGAVPTAAAASYPELLTDNSQAARSSSDRAAWRFR